MRIYLAGPLFSTAECNFNARLADELRARDHEIFLPQEHEQRADRPDLIFKSDREGIDWAQLVLANLDGPDPDSGTCWELGYGYGTNKAIMVFRTDFRLHDGADKINLMMTESANAVLILPKVPVAELAERIDSEIRHRFEASFADRVRMRADQYGGFDRPVATPRYRHADK